MQEKANSFHIYWRKQTLNSNSDDLESIQLLATELLANMTDPGELKC